MDIGIISMFKVNEIKSWAKQHGITVKKQGEGYVWSREGEEPSAPTDLHTLVRDVFNNFTEGRFIDHQRNYRAGT
jgi:hypothetical protein